MRRTAVITGLALVVLATCGTAHAQQSASYTVAEHVFNAGGHPERGLTMQSAGFRVSIDSIGDGLVRSGLSSASYRMDGGFGQAYPPPGEVQNLRFVSASSIAWDPEPSAGIYNVYVGRPTSLPADGGACTGNDLAATTWSSTVAPIPGQAWFYLVAVENQLGELGTSGYASSGAPRTTPGICP